MTDTDTNKKAALRRMKIIEGHVRKVREMIEQDAYCIDVLNQSTAVKNALKQVETMLLDDHLHNCVIRDAKKGNTQAIDELATLFKKVNK